MPRTACFAMLAYALTWGMPPPAARAEPLCESVAVTSAVVPPPAPFQACLADLGPRLCQVFVVGSEAVAFVTIGLCVPAA
jgi:hypothetical protein